MVCNNAGTVSNTAPLRATVDRFSNDQAIQDAKYNVAIQEIQDAHVEWPTLKGLVQLRPWSVEIRIVAPYDSQPTSSTILLRSRVMTLGDLPGDSLYSCPRSSSP